MAKIVLNDTAGGYNLQNINTNFQRIEDELNNKVLYRDNPVGEPNAMSNDLDMNSKRLYNLPEPLSPSEAARLQDVQSAISGAVQANLISFTPVGDIVSTTVQGAIEEVDSELHAAVADLANNSDSLKGDALVGVKLLYTGGKARTQHDKNADTVSILDFAGVDPTGVTDSTAGLQAALFATRHVSQGGFMRTLKWIAGTYKVTAPLICGSWHHSVFEPGVIVDGSGLPNETSKLFEISGQFNVTFEGNGAVLLGSRATAVIEGNQAGFYVYGADNVTIRDFDIRDMATDGITLTGDNAAAGPCRNIRIEGCDVSNNRRNGMSIIHADGVTVVGGLYRGSNGAPSGPWAGIDVEPNSDNYTRNINIIGARTRDNVGAGLLFVPANQGITAIGSVCDVTVSGYTSSNDGHVAGVGAIEFASGGAWANQVYGQIVVRDAVVTNPKSRGVNFKNWDPDKSPRAILDYVEVFNPDSTLSAAGNANRCGFVVSCDATQAISSMGNIVMSNCRAEDLRGVVRMVNGFYLDASVGKSLKNVRAVDPTSVSFTAGVKSDVNMAAVVLGTTSGCDVVYTTPKPVTLAGSQNIQQVPGKRIRASVNASTYTLPLAASADGLAYELEVNAGVTGTIITAQVGETIKPYGVAAALTLAVAAGDCVRIRSKGGTQWMASPWA